MAKTVCDLWNEFENKRIAASINAEIERDIEDLEYDIFRHREALQTLVVDNIDDIQKVGNKFVIIFKEYFELYHLIYMDMPEGIEIYDNDCGLRISIKGDNPELLDEQFKKIIATVEAAIADLQQKIETLNGRRRAS